MYFNRARFYDASRGRFVGEDPLGYGEGPNLYVYAFNSPSRFTDPTGKGAVAAVLPAAGGMAALDGPFPVGDVVAIGLIGVAATWDLIKVIEIVKTAEKCETQRCRLVDGNEEVGVPGTKGCRYACPDGTSFTLVVPESYWCTAEITRPSPVKKPPVKH